MHSNIPNTGPETKGLTSGRLDPSWDKLNLKASGNQ